MNILQQEDLIKGAPDQALLEEAQNPTGQVPQYLVISEIKRRTDMRKRFEAEEQHPTDTVAELYATRDLAYRIVSYHQF